MKNFIISILLVLQSILGYSQDCSQVFVFNINDKSTYSTSCGNQDQSDWVVKKNSCNFYTPLTNVGGKPGDADRWMDINLKIRGSNNLDEKDFAWIFYYVNGKTEVTKTVRGDQVGEFYKIRDSIAIPAGGNFKLRIAFVCDGPDEFWKLSNGDLTTCIRKVEGESAIAEVKESGKITFSKERDIVKLSWSTFSDLDGNYFVIERSKNGSQYEFAGYVKDNRSPGKTANYSFIDSGAFEPETWYRISKVGMNGKSAFFGKPFAVKL